MNKKPHMEQSISWWEYGVMLAESSITTCEVCNLHWDFKIWIINLCIVWRKYIYIHNKYCFKITLKHYLLFKILCYNVFNHLFTESRHLGSLIVYTRASWKVLGLAYNQSETWDKQSLGRDPDRSWCHRHTSVKLFWSQPMAPWTSAAAYANIHGVMGCDQKSFTLVWLWHQLLSGSLPNGNLSWVSCRL